jgi:hypothetical protein
MLERGVILVGDVVEVQPADVHLVDGAIAPADKCELMLAPWEGRSF